LLTASEAVELADAFGADGLTLKSTTTLPLRTSAILILEGLIDSNKAKFATNLSAKKSANCMSIFIVTATTGTI